MLPTVLLSSAYLAPIQYYSKLLHAPQVYIEGYSHYVKQTYHNRCLIATPQGVLPLTVPIVKPEGKIFLKDIKISEHGHWRHLHWNALEAAYNSTPFFEYYRDDFYPFYEQRQTYLFDFNEQLRQLICGLIGFDPSVRYTSHYMQAEEMEQCIDYREVIHPKKSPDRIDPLFRSEPYYQVFTSRENFIPYLSIVDLLFNMGPESLLVLRRSCPSTPSVS